MLLNPDPILEGITLGLVQPTTVQKSPPNMGLIAPYASELLLSFGFQPFFQK